MYRELKTWVDRHLSNPDVVALIAILSVFFFCIIYLGGILTPLITSVAIAYLLQWMINLLKRYKVPHGLSVHLVFWSFMGLFASFLFFIVPLLISQFVTLLEKMPAMLSSVQEFLKVLPESYPEFINESQVETLTTGVFSQLQVFGKQVLQASISSLPGLFSMVIYVILVPLLVFFLLKDKQQIIAWMQGFRPERSKLLSEVWSDVDGQLGNYIRGKLAEITIVGLATYLMLVYFKLEYAALLALLVGLSVLVPYVGATVVTVPVLLVGFAKYKLGPEFTYLTMGYFAIQILDGNVLVPLLFSEAVNLHPVAIIAAILFFGGIWGFWGIFFAIPLATLVKAVIDAWPKPVPVASEA